MSEEVLTLFARSGIEYRVKQGIKYGNAHNQSAAAEGVETGVIYGILGRKACRDSHRTSQSFSHCMAIGLATQVVQHEGLFSSRNQFFIVASEAVNYHQLLICYYLINLPRC